MFDTVQIGRRGSDAEKSPKSKPKRLSIDVFKGKPKGEKLEGIDVQKPDKGKRKTTNDSSDSDSSGDLPKVCP